MTTQRTTARWHGTSAIAGALIALAGIGVGALLTGSGATPALALSPEAGDAIPAIELDANTVAMVIDRNGLVFLVDQSARAIPVRFEERALNNTPGEEILRAR